MRHRHPLNIWHAKYLELSAIYNPECERVLTEKYISDDLQPMREQDTGQQEARGGLYIFFFFYKLIYKQRAYILALEYTD